MGQEGQSPEEQPRLDRQASTAPAAQRTQDQVLQQRLIDELTSFVVAHWHLFLLLVLGLVITWVVMLVLFIQAFMAAMDYYSVPCDQPLNLYVLAVVVWSQVANVIVRRCTPENWHPFRKSLLQLVSSMPGYIIMIWGLYMVNHAVTCPKTNPDLYYPTKRYIYGQICVAGLWVCSSAIAVYFLRPLLLILNRLIDHPGCEGAVHKLPKVEPNSALLISPEDGEGLACPICLESLQSGQQRGDGDDAERGHTLEPLTENASMVQTPCSHIFHEECLAQWCKNHTDCPLFRQPVGEPEIDGAAEP